MSLPTLARKVAQLLAAGNHKLVTAESCTGGLVCGTLTRVPGISRHLCGSMVTYRNETKHAYLGISPRTLKTPGPVSELVARLMAERVLERTPEATLSISITGHLGPQAPTDLDGVVFIAVARRSEQLKRLTLVLRHRCVTSHERLPRQREVIAAALGMLVEQLASQPPHD